MCIVISGGTIKKVQKEIHISRPVQFTLFIDSHQPSVGCGSNSSTVFKVLDVLYRCVLYMPPSGQSGFLVLWVRFPKCLVWWSGPDPLALLGWAQEFINNSAVCLLISSLPFTTPVVSGLLGLPFSHLQPESWDFSYSLCHILLHLHLHPGPSSLETEKKSNWGLPDHLRATAPVVRKTGSPLKFLSLQATVAAPGTVATMIPAELSRSWGVR